jgi:hypothetical protein
VGVTSSSPGRVSPFGVSSVVYCGWNQHLYEFNTDTKAAIDHTEAFKVT